MHTCVFDSLLTGEVDEGVGGVRNTLLSTFTIIERGISNYTCTYLDTDVRACVYEHKCID